MNKENKKILKPKKIKKEKDNSSKNSKPKKAKKIVWKIFKVIIILLIILAIIGGGVAIGVVSSIIDKTEGITDEQLGASKLTSFVYDKDGKEIGAFYDGENRVSVEYKDLPKHLVDAVISIEDERFFEHNGVDIKRTAAAVFNYVIHKGDTSFGGSTITQQLVKNIMKDKEKDWQRKIREWYRAISIEQKLSKEDIMSQYLNTVYLGDGKYGVELASQNYFAKSVKDVNIAESAILAALIQSPGSTDPYRNEESKARLIERQQLVLSQMLKLGKITKEQYDEAVNFKLEFKKGNTEISDKVQTYFVDAIFEKVVDDLMEQRGIDRGTAQKMVYTGGLKIYSTQDTKVQTVMDNVFKNGKIFYTNRDGSFMQGAMVVMDHTNGNVVGIIGGAGEKKGALVKNRATSELFKRQPGSTMKPLGAYGPAFEQGVLAPGMGIDDSPLPYGKYNPGNYYGYYNGYVTAREAIKRSMNLPALRATQRAGIEYSYNFAKNLGLKSLVPDDKGMAQLALGGVTNGFTVLEMCNAYATIANGGMYIEPKLYTKVLDKNGNAILETKVEPRQVMSPQTAYLLTSCLQSVTSSPGGTGYGYVNRKMPITGKTGNTNDDKDQWFIGYTPYYTTACWNGYDKPRPIGRRYPYASIVLFNDVMKEINKDLPYKNFVKPNGIFNAEVCRDSGLVATDACKHDSRGSRVITDIFATGKVPTKFCDVHKEAVICKESGLIANEYCKETETRSFITRNFVPHIKPRDWAFMLPTKTCEMHNEETARPKPDPEEENKPDDGEDTKPDNGDNKPEEDKKPENNKPVKPDNNKPSKPDNGKPDNNKPVKPDNGKPSKPDNGKPDNGKPSKPDKKPSK